MLSEYRLESALRGYATYIPSAVYRKKVALAALIGLWIFKEVQ